MANRTMRGLVLTERGWAALARTPLRTWDEVLAQSKIGSCNPSDMGRRPTPS